MGWEILAKTSTYTESLHFHHQNRLLKQAFLISSQTESVIVRFLENSVHQKERGVDFLYHFWISKRAAYKRHEIQ